METEVLPDIQVYKFSFRYLAEGGIVFPRYSGSLFRGSFGWAFRKTICVTKAPECTGCIVSDNCGYFKLFETEKADHELWFLKNVKKVPHPFIIHPTNINNDHPLPVTEFEVGLTIIGDAIKYLSYFVYTFIQMGKQGFGSGQKKAELVNVDAYRLDGTHYSIYSNENKSINIKTPPPNINEAIDEKDYRSSLIVEFHTPLRLQKGGQILKKKEELQVSYLFSILRKRVLTLSHLYCNGNNIRNNSKQVDENITVVRNELRFFTWKRYSSRQERVMDLGGFLGELELSNLNETQWKLLKIGSLINVGKNSLFGLGAYKLKNNVL